MLTLEQLCWFTNKEEKYEIWTKLIVQWFENSIEILTFIIYENSFDNINDTFPPTQVAPVITYKNACEEICEEAEEWEPEVGEEEDDVVEEVILPGVDWESVCYQVQNLPNFFTTPDCLLSGPQFTPPMSSICLNSNQFT